MSVDDMLEDLGRKLAIRRARHGLTRTDLANRKPQPSESRQASKTDQPTGY